MKSRFSERQILDFLRQAAAGTPVVELCWNHCISRSTFRAWKAKYGAAIGAEVGRLKQLERENARLREALARATADRGSARSGAVPHPISSATLPKKRSSASSRSAPPW
jgi:putative transposase